MIMENKVINKLVELENRKAYYKNELALLEQEIDGLKEEIFEDVKNLESFENEEIKISYAKETVRKGVDAKKLQEEYPQVYSECLKETKVKEHLKITIKKGI